MNGRKTRLACGYAAGALGCALAFASQVQVSGAGSAGVVGGEFVVEPATLISLGFEWYVDGDDNRDATVGRVVSQSRAEQLEHWAASPPLQAERIKQGQQIDVTVPNMFCRQHPGSGA